jgi:hypothetical protein
VKCGISSRFELSAYIYLLYTYKYILNNTGFYLPFPSFSPFSSVLLRAFQSPSQCYSLCVCLLVSASVYVCSFVCVLVCARFFFFLTLPALISLFLFLWMCVCVCVCICSHASNGWLLPPPYLLLCLLPSFFKVLVAGETRPSYVAVAFFVCLVPFPFSSLLILEMCAVSVCSVSVANGFRSLYRCRFIASRVFILFRAGAPSHAGEG